MHGPSGSGKDTQVNLLSEKFPEVFELVSTGAMFRELKDSKVPAEFEIYQKVTSGELISDDLTYKFFTKFLNRFDPNKVWVLVGVVRSANQIKFLDKALLKHARTVDLYFNLDVSEQVSIERLCNRLQCTTCNNIYTRDDNIANCAKCGSALDGRPEDAEVQKIIRRLYWYREEAEKIFDHYSERGEAVKIDAGRQIEEISKELIDIMVAQGFEL